MPINNSLDEGKTDSYTWELRTGMQALECAKQLVYIGHIETGTVVTHII
jgi:hypothetical protein